MTESRSGDGCGVFYTRSLLFLCFSCSSCLRQADSTELGGGQQAARCICYEIDVLKHVLELQRCFTAPLISREGGGDGLIPSAPLAAHRSCHALFFELSALF